MRRAPKIPPIAQIIIANKVIAMLSPNKNFAPIKIKTPSTAFIARLVAVLRILYNTKATIIARINTMISVIGNTIVPSKEFYLFIIIIEFSRQ